jgi:hypothetical protein
MRSQLGLEVDVLADVFIKFTFFRISSNFRSKNSSDLFAREAYLVKCLRRFLAFKISFART